MLTRHSLSALILLGLVLFSMVTHGQTRQDEFQEAAAEFDDAEEAETILPDAVGDDLGSDALRFFFVAAKPSRQKFFYREANEYLPIRPAYNSFGNIHHISSRSKLTLYSRVEKGSGNAKQFTYSPLFELSLSGISNLFAVFLPAFEPSRDGTVYPLNVIDFSPNVFPYDHVTFMNTLTQPLLVRLEDESAVLQPGQVLRSTYTIQRKGVGYLAVSLAIREPEDNLRLLYNKRIPAYEGERTIAVPIADPWGSRGIEVLLYRDTTARKQ